MKNFYWGGTGLLLLQGIRHLLKSKNNRSRTLFSFVLSLSFLLFSNLASAQEPRKDSGADGRAKITPLQVGDKLPDYIWQQEIDLHYFDGSSKTISFSDLKGKVILFDFWSTGCPSCIAGFPKMEEYQKKYSDDLVVVLVNSKRNKETPERIANRFKVYKEVYGYTPVLPSILDDTLFTSLFPHNSIPNNTFINKDGVYLGSSMGGKFSQEQLQSIITTGTTDIIHNGIFRNQGNRKNVPPLVDTANIDFFHGFIEYQPHYLSAELELSHKNGHSFFQKVNFDFLSFCNDAFKKEIKGFSISDFVFEDQIANDILQRIFLKDRNHEAFCYQLFSKDSIGEEELLRIHREDFLQYFKIGVKRQTSEIDTYVLELTDAFSKIETKGGMRRSTIDSEETPTQFSNFSIRLLLGKLIYWLDRPITVTGLSQEELLTNVDVEIPAFFSNFSEKEQLLYLESLGLKFTPQRVRKEYPLFYSARNNQSPKK
ncbi:TlpA family protein disulfide reductase [Sphingobacterium shayense]|uniref:TlpA family protein disulfide reductase n=1 Tax=Sphingobacterium shayense TaxID=626343 RepID=UPI0015535DAA|nr:TlpA disulfide reductase family protein [Sphingobacterium shayense]NQD72100.1 TlpA family protein disulfide reductase [Sphingobacterium shayense]